MADMDLMWLCFNNLTGYVEVSVGGTAGSNRKWLELPVAMLWLYKPGVATDVYFGPALRAKPDHMGKANCTGSQVCWVDYDSEDEPLVVLQPTAKVFSGHGWHLYWQLDKFCDDYSRIEEANKALAGAMHGDSAHNIDRLLRLPGTMNTKSVPHRECKLLALNTDIIYSIDDLVRLNDLTNKSIRKIVKGDQRGYPSRSERDLAIVRVLVEAGYEDNLIIDIFTNCACGDKFRDPRTRGLDYLTHTIKKIRSTTSPMIKIAGPTGAIMERDRGYYSAERRGARQLSTFTFEPSMLLEGDKQDAIVGNVTSQYTDYVWENVVFPQSAFRSMRNLLMHLNKLSWVWLGRESDIRSLQSYLMSKLEAIGIPRARASSVIGRQTLPNDDRTFFVSNVHTLASDGSVWEGAFNNPVLYVPTGREAPELILDIEATITPADLASIATLLPLLNEPGCIWPMIGWFAATLIKPALEQLGYRFPILNVTGTRGSGKTTLIVYTFQRLLGYKDPRSYNANTTHFVTLSLLGSTNCVPIAFSEFRAASSGDFLRYILLSYDTGRDARGRPDQTTVEYPLIAPFSLDGEDMVEDSAALERIVSIVLTQHTIQEGTGAYQAHEDIIKVPLEQFALPYISYTLSVDIPSLVAKATAEVHSSLPPRLPTRIRNNLTVCWIGIRLIQQFFAHHQIEFAPGLTPEVLSTSLNNIYSPKLGRAPVAADTFAEYVVNNAAQKREYFPWLLRGSVLWFQLTPAFNSYRRQESMQRRTVLSRDAVRVQLKELIDDYTVAPQVMEVRGKRVLVYGIDMQRAYDAGLDLPSSFISNQFTVQV